jgi:hypothetical protein
MKKLITWLVVIPNLPFLVVLAIYIGIKLWKTTRSFDEFISRIGDDDLLTDDIIKHTDKIFSSSFAFAFAITFYMCLVLEVW